MARSGLNLSALRSNTLFRSKSADLSLSDAAKRSPSNGPTISRRKLLGAAGVAVLGAAPAMKSARVALSGQFEMAGDERRLAFLLGGKERWVVEPERFGGKGKLSIERTAKSIVVELRDACWPGTDLNAGFRCEIRPGATGSKVSLEGLFGGFKASGSFEKWLLGLAPLRSTIRPDGDVTSLAKSGKVGLKGKGLAELRPDWSVEIDGEEIASVDLYGQNLRSDVVTIALANESAPSLLEEPDRHRTMISLTRGDRAWEIVPRGSRGEGWRVAAEKNAFDELVIEAGENRRGVRRQALTAGSNDATGRFGFLPNGSFATPAGTPFALPLERPRYGIEFAADGDRSAIVADYPEKGVPLRADGFGLKLGRGSSGETFELLARDAAIESLVCAPRILSASLPIRGAVVQPARPRNPGRLHFFRNSGTPSNIPAPGAAPPDAPDMPLPDEDGEVTLDETKETVVTFPLNDVIWVLRPADMLWLGFEFINLKFTSGAGKKPSKKAATDFTANQASNTANYKAAPPKAPTDPIATQASQYANTQAKIVSSGNATTNKPYLVVHFPPQNIAERAYWEAEETPGMSEESGPNMNNPGGSEPPDLPPVEHRAAGPSRLAFSLPKGTTELPYTLSSLLDWASLEPSLVPVALPPPPPPSAALGSIMGINTAITNRISFDKGAGKLAAGGRSGRALSGRAPTETSTRVDLTANKNALFGGAGIATSGAMTPQGLSAKANLAETNQELQASPELMTVLATEDAGSKFGLYLDLAAAIPKIQRPDDHHTAIEAPYRLFISPHAYSAWAHSIEPVTRAIEEDETPKTELWHTRLGVRSKSGAVDERDTYYRTIRAIWSPDYTTGGSPPSNNLPFRMSLNGRDRYNLVRLTSDFTISKWTPDPVSVDRLMLSPLGAWMNVRGAWELPTTIGDLSVEEWRHRGTMGRDHYVRVVYKGYLFPFGHRASLIKVTERKIRKFSRGGYMAYMYQRMYIVVRQPVKDYPALGQPFGARRTPFRSVRLTSLVTPNIDQPDVGASAIGAYGDEAFWPRVAGQDFLFNIVATDWEGKQSEFSTPLAFVNYSKAFTESVVNAVINTYDDNPDGNGPRNKRSMQGQSISYAPADKPSDTAFETDYVVFGVDKPAPDAPDVVTMREVDQPYFYPTFVTSKVRIDAVEQISGTQAYEEIELYDKYIEHGIEGSQNKGSVFAKLKNEVSLSFSSNADKAGGIATPNMNVSGLSRKLGTVAGEVEKVAGGEFDPKSFFSEDLMPQLLGGISLADIIGAINDFAGDIIKIPQMVNSKSFENPKALLSTIQNVVSAVDDVKDDVEKMGELKNQLQDSLAGIQSLPDALETASQAVQDQAESLRQKALATLKQIDDEAQKILKEAQTYAESLVNKIRSLSEGSLVDVLEALGLPTELTLELKWGPRVNSWPNPSNPVGFMGPNALFYVVPGQEENVFVLLARLTIKLDGSDPQFLLEGKAQNFRIQLIPIEDVADEGFVHLQFDKLRFYSESAKKPEVDIVFNLDTGITFHGPLHFIEVIRQYIPFDGFSDPPSLDVSPTGIIAGFTFPIPSIAIGVFSLQNISLGATLELPFLNSPIVFTFLFCTRDNPFVLTVSMLGGGGFFGLIVTTKEIGFEAALEFGGNFSFNIGIASGGVYIMAGVYYKKLGEECILEGYLKLGGSLEILGLITISVEFYMSLTYQEPGGKVIGQATLTVKVEILCFSKSVSLHVERRFKGSANDPLFKDLMAPEDWTEYCLAYA